MKKIIMSSFVILAVAAIAGYATISYFSDTETSTGNTFTAGAIDLTVDNECYYNGKACVGGYWDGTQEACACTWDLDDLSGKVFFNFADLKPGDTEEDTISLHVDTNPAWACAKITLTSDIENGCTEPELEDDSTCETDNVGDLAKELQFVWWADDGDNVLEDNEAAKIQIGGGVQNTFDWMMNEDTQYFGNQPNEMLLTLSDSQTNFFNPGNIAPLTNGISYYIGKAMCFGTLGLNPVNQDNEITSGPLDGRGTGVTCDGEDVSNASQTDQITAELEFYVEQARNNAGFLCPEHQPRT
jgi:predicted ribosomally synthesized peptide with SipW-like signal peptide